MLKSRMALLLPVVMLSLAVLACNFPGTGSMDAQASSEEVAALVDAAVQEMSQEGVQVELISDGPKPIEGEGLSTAQEDQQPEAEPTEEPDPVVTEEPTATAPEIEACTDRAQFITDVSVEDGADFAPDQAFTKTWRLRNSGTCTWTSSYDLVFDHGDQMNGPANKALPGLVHPGDTVDLSVDLTAPSTAGGYKGYWLLRNAENVLFGIGSNANVAFWVEIEVLEDDDGGFPEIEILPIPMFPIFVSNGTDQGLGSGACFDLDAGSAVPCGSAAADFKYDPEFQMLGFPPTPKLSLEIQPRNGARFALFGDDLPTGNDCQAAALNNNSFKIQVKVYCYQTDAGKYGRLTVVDGDLGGLTFDWATYTFP